PIAPGAPTAYCDPASTPKDVSPLFHRSRHRQWSRSRLSYSTVRIPGRRIQIFTGLEGPACKRAQPGVDEPGGPADIGGHQLLKPARGRGAVGVLLLSGVAV